MISRFLPVLVGLICHSSTTFGHVRLQYPLARDYGFDALGNKWNPGPCGMPRGANLTTDLQSGSSFNITWNLGDTHKGGLRVELLDANYNMIRLLVPSDGDLSDASPAHFTTKYGVSGLWYGDNPAPTMQQVTLPTGLTCRNCVIRVLKWGQQLDKTNPEGEYYFNSCADVNIITDNVTMKCSGHGQWTGNSCLCQKPYVGASCQYTDECADDTDCGPHGTCVDTQAQAYPKKQCYCSAGWHGGGCAMESSVKTADFKPENYFNRTARFGNFTFFWRILDNVGEIEVVIVAKAKNWIAVGWRPSGVNTNCKAFPVVKPDTMTTLKADGTSETIVIDFMDRNSSFFTGSLHPMACHDITYIGTVGTLSRFRDTYTRDHSTPREDTVFGGTDGLTAAVAYEDPTTGAVVALYRKKLIALDPSDVSVTDQSLHVIWSMGQDPFDPRNSDAKSTDQLTNDQILKQFPRKGDFNSHAHNAKSRGFWEVNLRTGATFDPSSAPSITIGPAKLQTAITPQKRVKFQTDEGTNPGLQPISNTSSAAKTAEMLNLRGCALLMLAVLFTLKTSLWN